MDEIKEKGAQEVTPVTPETQPLAEGPIEGQPIEGQPIEGQPIEGQPIEGQPIEGQPIEGQPIGGQPIGAQPIGGQPIGAQPTPEKIFCTKCGAELARDQQFCPKCGQPVGQPVQEGNKAKPNKTLVGIIGGVVAVVLIIAIILIVRGTQAKSVTLNKESVSVKVDETATLTYTIDPEDTKNKTVTWKSSNESIATVNNGTVVGINEGDCTITVTTKNGKTDTCEITVLPAGPDFLGLFNDYCDSTWAEVGSDGSYLSIDTNPFDKDDTGIAYTEAYLAILAVNEALGLPESLNNDMETTTALMGRQTQDFDDVSVSWSYHPDRGMEVTYKAR